SSKSHRWDSVTCGDLCQRDNSSCRRSATGTSDRGPQTCRRAFEMTHLIIRPTPRVFHRYKSEEMSGPLPPSLFKVLPEVYGHRLMELGEMMWSTLAWFQNE